MRVTTRFFLLEILCALVAISLTPLANAKPLKLPAPKNTEASESIPKIIKVDRTGLPSDAIVLFDHGQFDAWRGKKGAVQWTLHGDYFTVKPKTGSIFTKESFCDIQLHIEWKSPAKIPGKSGQKLGNSGVFFQGRYEVQVLDSYENLTYPNGQAGAVYKQHIPLVNAMKPTGEWQVYDIIYTAPQFSKTGQLLNPATVTVLHNGVLIQNHVELKGSTSNKIEPTYKPHGCAPIRLQNHSDSVSYRNIWVRKL